MHRHHFTVSCRRSSSSSDVRLSDSDEPQNIFTRPTDYRLSITGFIRRQRPRRQKYGRKYKQARDCEGKKENNVYKADVVVWITWRFHLLQTPTDRWYICFGGCRRRRPLCCTRRRPSCLPDDTGQITIVFCFTIIFFRDDRRHQPEFTSYCFLRSSYFFGIHSWNTNNKNVKIALS